MKIISRNRLVAIAAVAGLATSAMALSSNEDNRVTSSREIDGTPIADVLTTLPADVNTYNEHITILASPFFEGRVPGSRGMEIAREYVQTHFVKFGMQPAFPDESGEPFASFRDPFDLGGTWEAKSEDIVAFGPNGAVSLSAEQDFVFTGLGGNGRAAGQAVFVGYGIENGPDGFNSYGEDLDLTGKIAVMFRYEPLDREGLSRWTEGTNFTGNASFNNKVRAAAERGADAVVIINPPGVHEGRPDRLQRFGGSSAVDIPVFLLNSDGGAKMLDALGVEESLRGLRRHADRGDAPIEMEAMLALAGQGERQPLAAENVGAMFPGAGDLADEYIIVGAHMDHLGMGYFGSRTGPGSLHPGADDNASGTAGLLLLAEEMQKRIAEMGEGTPRRSIVLIAFDGEESGLNGSRHYVVDPIAPLDDHVLMCNWDMIGRLQNDTVSVSGVGSGAGLLEFIEPFFESSGLTVVPSDNFLGGSDHLPFYRNDIPVLFGALQRLHGDYHTPAETSDKINRVGATKTVMLFADFVTAITQTDQRFAFQSPQERAGSQSAGGPPQIRVRVGVMPGSYNDDEDGIPIGGVTPDGPAEAAGLREGDRLIRWDGVKITGVEDWMERLADHEPGDKVRIGVIREGEEITLELTLGER